MEKKSYRHSIEFLKETFKLGSKKQREWALDELFLRWKETKEDKEFTQTLSNIFL